MFPNGNLCSIDIVAKYKSRAIAIEVDGPFHYMVNRCVCASAQVHFAMMSRMSSVIG